MGSGICPTSQRMISNLDLWNPNLVVVFFSIKEINIAVKSIGHRGEESTGSKIWKSGPVVGNSFSKEDRRESKNLKGKCVLLCTAHWGH